MKISPTTVFFIQNNEEKTKHRNNLKEKENCDNIWKELTKFLLKQTLLFIIFPFVPILAHIKLIMGHIDTEVFSDSEESARELTLIFVAIEAPLQILFTSWLILRGIVRSPLNFDETEIISWATDKFGNPIPVPTIPLASILTSALSLMLAATRISFASWPSLDTVQILTFLSKLSFILFSTCYRIVSVSFLWIYFDSKTSLLIFTILILNFLLAYRSEIRRKKKQRLDQPIFAIWFTSFIGIFIPCWYFRNIKRVDENKPLPSLRIQTTVGNILIIFWLLFCIFLVNWSSYRYNNNCLNNQDFNFCCIFLIILGMVHIAKNIIWFNSSEKMLLTRNVITLVSNVVIFSLTFCCFCLYSMHIRDSGKISLITQHHNKTNGTEIFIKSYSAKSLSVNKALYGEICKCEDFQNENESLSDERVLLVDTINTECHTLLQKLSRTDFDITSEYEGALILEDWTYRSSSPFPFNHKNMNMSYLLTFPQFPVLAIEKLDDVEYQKFNRYKTFISVRFNKYPKSLEDFSKNHLTIDCGSYGCLNFHESETDKVFLNNESFPSRNVQIALEEEYLSHDLYTLSQTKHKSYKMNIRCKETLKYREIEDLLCYSFPNFWEERYLENYKCCTSDNNPVFSTKSCKKKEAQEWGPWSLWGSCSKIIGSLGIETIRKRFRFSKFENTCLFIEKEIESCSKYEKVGGCMIATVADTVPTC